MAFLTLNSKETWKKHRDEKINLVLEIDSEF